MDSVNYRAFLFWLFCRPHCGQRLSSDSVRPTLGRWRRMRRWMLRLRPRSLRGRQEIDRIASCICIGLEAWKRNQMVSYSWRQTTSGVGRDASAIPFRNRWLSVWAGDASTRRLILFHQPKFLYSRLFSSARFPLHVNGPCPAGWSERMHRPPTVKWLVTTRVLGHANHPNASVTINRNM